MLTPHSSNFEKTNINRYITETEIEVERLSQLGKLTCAKNIEFSEESWRFEIH